MNMYKHIWKYEDSPTDVMDEGKFALSLDEAVSEYYQEQYDWRLYVKTLVLDTQKKTFSYIDIEEEILQRSLAERTDAEIAANRDALRGDFMRRDM